MPDNWSFVIAAYLLAAVVLGAYWRHLVKKERQLESHERMDQPVKGTPGRPVNQSVKGMPLNQSVKGTEPRAPGPAHLRSEPTTRHPLQ
jgi:hypothetical protein